MQKIWQGVWWKVISCGCFAGINVLVRYLSGGSPLANNNPLPIYTIMFWQNILGALIISAWMFKSRKAYQQSISSAHLGLNILRVLSAALGIGLWYLSLRYIPVTQVVALSFIAPIITTLGAAIFLKESLDLPRGLAILLSILGGFLIARPDKAIANIGNFDWFLALPLIAAFVFSLDKLLTRRLLVFNADPSLLAWYLLIFIGPICLIPTCYYGWVSPTLAQVPWLLVLGLLGALAHYTFNRAYELAEVTLLLPFGAAKIILCAILSYMAFVEVPKTFDMWLGIITITLSTMILSIDPSVFKSIFPRKLIGAKEFR